MQDYEKLGAFYLGKRVAEPSGQLTDELVLYDSKDLTTHAVIVGMTGSGKTGLGIALIEEAAIDHVPVIAIDPKGDLGNLLLTFPQLGAEDFEPWIDQRAALEAGATTAEHAERTAALWRQGLADWGQAPERIGKLRAAADICLYTPGSTAGAPLAVLSRLDPPGAESLADEELYRDLVDGSVDGLLTLLGIAGDGPTGREHILLAGIFDQAWRAGRTLDLPALVAAVQTPGFTRVGVMDLDVFFPPQERFALAMRLNALLASPRFQAWATGSPLDVDRLLYTTTGQSRVSILSIAHLDDAERMFVVTMLLNRLVAWMRRQPGSASLRAVLYMDEVFGFMPPVANPPSKRLLLTLLKQARAYGLGVVLATQNPVDLDYKGLANAGTWFIGRLQTERDKARLIEGLRNAAGGERLAARDLDATLASLGKRRFLLHNVHEAEAAVLETRWVMSYLAGPLTREQIKRLAPQTPAADTAAAAAPTALADRIAHRQPVLPPAVKQRFLPAAPTVAGARWAYRPKLLAMGELQYVSARPRIDTTRPFALLADLDPQVGEVDWARAEQIEIVAADLATEPAPGAEFEILPAQVATPDKLRAAEAALKRWLREHLPLLVYHSPALGVTSDPGETERDFRIRLQQLGNARRDLEAAQLRRRYAAELERMQERLRRTEHALEREQGQAADQRLDTVVSVGAALLGSLLGRRRVSVSTASRIGTAVRKAARTRQESGDVARAEENVASQQRRMADLEAELQRELDAMSRTFDAQTEPLAEIAVKSKPSGLHVAFLGVGWLPVAVGGHSAVPPSSGP